MSEQGRVQGVNELSGGTGKRKKTGGDGGNGGGKKKVLLVIVLIGFIIFMLVSSGGIQVMTVKDIFSGSPNENLESMFTGIKDVERMNKRPNQPIDKIYDKNNIYEDRVAYMQTDKEYIVYVYTGDKEMDVEFNKWVDDNQNKYKVYKLNRSEMYTQEEMLMYASEEPSPLMYIFKEVDKGEKVIHDVIIASDELPGLSGTMDSLIEKRKAK